MCIRDSPWGTCWAFGALAAGESSLIKNGAANNSVDLSEMHLSYFFFHSVADPMKLTSGDKVINQTGSKYLDTGGNNLFTMFALSRWVGAAAEETVPYGGDVYKRQGCIHRTVCGTPGNLRPGIRYTPGKSDTLPPADPAAA